MKRYDSHVHIGDYKLNLYLLENSIYRNKYKLYSCIDSKVLSKQDQYISRLDDFFALPLFFKESNIRMCNEYVLNYCNEIKKGIPVLLIDDNINYDDTYKIALFKEHFLLHKYEDWNKRSLFYDFLNENEGYLLIHCRDNIRIEYINQLLHAYKKMNIIIAHLGRNSYEDYEFIDNVLNNFKNNEKIFFDISTIHNLLNVQNSIQKIGSERIFYGSDFPFEVDDYNVFFNERNDILSILSSNESDNIFEKNFENIKKKIYVR